MLNAFKFYKLTHGINPTQLLWENFTLLVFMTKVTNESNCELSLLVIFATVANKIVRFP